jgi:hypothetical protein
VRVREREREREMNIRLIFTCKIIILLKFKNGRRTIALGVIDVQRG